MFLVKILVVINTIYSVTLCCKSKVKPISKEKVIECIFENVTEPKDQLYLFGNETTDYFSQKLLKYFSASKPNIATLPCYELDVRLFDYSNGITDQYLKKFRRFTNTPMECQAYCQGEEICHFFTFELDTNQCLLFTDIDYDARKYKKDGYISGPKYCETNGGFQIQINKPWLGFNDTFVWHDLPMQSTHAWESCTRSCSANKNCISFDYCFSTETNSSEIFQCHMKSDTLTEKTIKTPKHCVKSVKQICNSVRN